MALVEHASSNAVVHSKRTHLTEALLNVCADILVQPNNTSAVQQICDEIIEQMPNVKLVWTWFGKADSPVIRPQFIAGTAADYAKHLSLETAELASLNPAAIALQGRKSEAYKINVNGVGTQTWRKAAQLYGIRSILTVPLALPQAKQVGLMVLYADHCDYFDSTEMGRGLFEALGKITGAILLKQSQARKLEHLAFYDGLTGQMNRNGLYDALHVEPQAGYGVMIDIDFFKQINDTYGHPAGDVVLAKLGGLIDRHTLKRRQADVNQHLHFYSARWGGEEFFVYVGGATLAQALAWAESLRLDIMQMQCQLSDVHQATITASFGIAYCPDSHAMLRGAIEQADAALYQAKASGRNCTVVFSHANHALHTNGLLIEADL